MKFCEGVKKDLVNLSTFIASIQEDFPAFLSPPPLQEMLDQLESWKPDLIDFEWTPEF